MIDSASSANRNLRIAGYCLLFEILIGAAFDMVLERNGFAPGLALLAVWLFNLVVAWHLSRAAGDLGKNRWLYGVVAALGPPLAIPVFATLRLHDRIHRLSSRGLSTNAMQSRPGRIAPWIHVSASGSLFGAIVSSLLAFLGITHFKGDHRSEHIGFTIVFVGIFCLLTGYTGHVGLFRRHVHPLMGIGAFLLAAASAIAVLTWLYTRHVT